MNNLHQHVIEMVSKAVLGALEHMGKKPPSPDTQLYLDLRVVGAIADGDFGLGQCIIRVCDLSQLDETALSIVIASIENIEKGNTIVLHETPIQ